MSKRSARGGSRLAQVSAPEPEPELEVAELQLSSDEEYESGEESDLVSLSGGEDDAGVDREIEDAVLGYMAAAEKNRQDGGSASGSDDEGEHTDSGSGEEGEERSQEGGEGRQGAAEPQSANLHGAAAAAAVADDGDDDEQRPDDPASDSSEDERPNRNTIGDVPLVWYKDEEHVGYDAEGKKLARRPRRDRLEKHLAASDNIAKEMRTVYDEYNDEEIELSKEEMRMIQRIRAGQFPHVEVNPYEPEVDWFTRDVEVMPFNAAPEPKRRFVPSKWEEKKVVKLVRALRKGWIKRGQVEPEKPTAYLIWEDDGKTLDKTATGLTYIPAPKLKLPGHEESYNPAPEYLPTEEERNAEQLLDDEDRPQFVPTAYDCLRRVPAYANFIKERFERCLDLYLCPRTRRKRLIIEDPEVLVPKLPKPQDLQPFPTLLSVRYTGHSKVVRSVCPDPTGQWLLSGSDDGTVRLWEVRTGRCMQCWRLEEPVSCVAWCPSPGLSLLAAASGKRLLLLPSGVGNEEQEAATEAALAACTADSSGSSSDGIEDGQLVSWQRWQGGGEGQGGSSGSGRGSGSGGVVVLHKFGIKHVTWHARGDYFATTAPTGNTQAVLVNQLSKGVTQNPFRKNRGRVVRVLFHPSKPFFFVATQQNVRVYNLAKQALAKKLVSGSGVITSMAIHPTGDHLIVGSEDKRLCWFDLDLSAKPYRSLRYHQYAVRGAAFHRTYPLLASSSDDATVHVFHGMVYADLMTNPLIVPVKILRGHEMVDYQGVLDVAFHPTQPWIFTAGADATICLFVNP
ncbi:hypothetical protein D9Q98_001186 [Chlorella vulgaris]|uniref:Ribosome biogenesis protein BOP1 homolog n=1 Tax=Chlorella vulgaris TaxID=3077 RepID=A0A9D4TZZ2_CHLVU|nr:hypothetical protein D9Q98_001186 [Chlorella vulgaris]